MLASFQLLPNLERVTSPLIPKGWNESEMFYVCAQSSIKYGVSRALLGGPCLLGRTTLRIEEKAWGGSGLSEMSGKAARGREASEYQEAEAVQGTWRSAGPRTSSIALHVKTGNFPQFTASLVVFTKGRQSQIPPCGTQSAWDWSSTFLMSLLRRREYSDFSSSPPRSSGSEF